VVVGLVTCGKEDMLYLAFICMLATSHRSYWLDIHENFYQRCIFGQGSRH